MAKFVGSGTAVPPKGVAADMRTNADKIGQEGLHLGWRGNLHLMTLGERMLLILYFEHPDNVRNKKAQVVLIPNL